MKYILTPFILFFLLGCSEQFPPPENAIKECLQKGWQPNYYSSASGTTFTCKPLKSEK